MPSASMRYPSVKPIVFGESGRYVLKEEDLRKIFYKKGFLEKVALLREDSTITELLSVIRIFDCNIAQIMRILKGKNSTALDIIPLLSEHGSQLKKCGFGIASISSMLHGGARSAPIVISEILAHTPKLISLKYSPQNISSMLCGAGQSSHTIIHEVLANTDALLDLGYKVTNISSILNGVGSSIFSVMTTLLRRTTQLTALGYSATNISSMINGVGSFAPSAVFAILKNTKPLLDLGLSHNNISRYLFYKSCSKYSIYTEEILTLSSRVLALGYSKSDLRQLFYDRVPSCQSAIELMQSIIDTHDAFRAFSAQTPSHIVQIATCDGQDFDVDFFTTHLYATQAVHSSKPVYSARQARSGRASHVEMLLRPCSSSEHQDRACT